MNLMIDFIQKIEDKTSEIIYFGGSFNPWHQGHSQCLFMAPVDKTKVVIFDNNPQKSLNERSAKLPEDLPPLSFIYHWQGQQANPTHQWLHQVTKKFPKHKHSLLMGYDSYMGMSKWIRPESIFKDVFKLYVVNRMNLEQKKLYPCEVEFLGGHQFEQLASSKIIDQ